MLSSHTLGWMTGIKHLTIFLSMSSIIHFLQYMFFSFYLPNDECEKHDVCALRILWRTQCDVSLYIKSAWKPLHKFLGRWLLLRNMYTTTILLDYQHLFTVHRRRCFKNLDVCSYNYKSKFAYLQLLFLLTIQTAAQLRWLWHHRYSIFHPSYGSNIQCVDDRAIIFSCLDSV